MHVKTRFDEHLFTGLKGFYPHLKETHTFPIKCKIFYLEVGLHVVKKTIDFEATGHAIVSNHQIFELLRCQTVLELPAKFLDIK